MAPSAAIGLQNGEWRAMPECPRHTCSREHVQWIIGVGVRARSICQYRFNSGLLVLKGDKEFGPGPWGGKMLFAGVRVLVRMSAHHSQA